MVGYMRGGAVVLAARTMAPNRFDPYAPPIPVAFYTDGEWVWSMEAGVGVRDYAMGLPDAFVEKVVQLWGACPVVDEAARVAAQQHIQGSGMQR